MKKILPFLLIFQSCLGASDMFATRTKIIGNYYLVEEEDGGYSIGYKIDEGFIGRSPSNSKVLAYAIRDSVLVMKVQFYDSTSKFYILNMNKDGDYADEKDIFIDTISEKDYKNSWIGNFNFKSIE